MARPSLHSGVSSRPDDRRSAPRYAANLAPAVINWHDGEQVRTARVALTDVSMCGARARAAVPIPEGAAVMVRLPGCGAGEPFRATVAGVCAAGRFALFRRKPPGYLIRLSFPGGCPYEAFKASVEEFVSETEVPDVLDAEGFDLRDWR